MKHLMGKIISMAAAVVVSAGTFGTFASVDTSAATASETAVLDDDWEVTFHRLAYTGTYTGIRDYCNMVYSTYGFKAYCNGMVNSKDGAKSYVDIKCYDSNVVFSGVKLTYVGQTLTFKVELNGVLYDGIKFEITGFSDTIGNVFTGRGTMHTIS